MKYTPRSCPYKWLGGGRDAHLQQTHSSYIVISQWPYYPWPITHSHLPSGVKSSHFSSAAQKPLSPLHFCINSKQAPWWCHMHHQPSLPLVLRPKPGNRLACFSKRDFHQCWRVSPRPMILTTGKSLLVPLHCPPPLSLALASPLLWVGQHIVFISPTILRLNRETIRASCFLHVYGVDPPWPHLASWSSRPKSPTWSRSSCRWPLSL
jgi:hypothetical protein